MRKLLGLISLLSFLVFFIFSVTTLNIGTLGRVGLASGFVGVYTFIVYLILPKKEKK